MKTRTFIIATFILIIVSLLVGVASYSRLPAQAVTHWNAQGQPDGYSSRFSAAFLMPIMLVVVVGLMLLLPRIDPMRFNAAGFRESYYFIVLLVVVFLVYLQALTILYNFGVHFDMLLAMTPAMALLDFALAYLLRRTKPNWFIGIRTPWTLSNAQVWEETHKVGSIGFVVAGVLTLFGLLFPQQAFFFIIAPLLTVAVYTIVYSYFSYRRITG